MKLALKDIKKRKFVFGLIGLAIGAILLYLVIFGPVFLMAWIWKSNEAISLFIVMALVLLQGVSSKLAKKTGISAFLYFSLVLLIILTYHAFVSISYDYWTIAMFLLIPGVFLAAFNLDKNADKKIKSYYFIYSVVMDLILCLLFVFKYLSS